MENSDQTVPIKVGLLLRKPLFFKSTFSLALVIAALLLSWLILLQTPGNRAGVLVCKALSLSKSVSNLDQEFAWAAITPKSLYFCCCLIALNFCVS